MGMHVCQPMRVEEHFILNSEPVMLHVCLHKKGWRRNHVRPYEAQSLLDGKNVALAAECSSSEQT